MSEVPLYCTVVPGSGFRVSGWGFGFLVSRFGFRVLGFGFRVHVSCSDFVFGFRVPG